MTDPCAVTRELLPELAAGVANGSERAVALAHLAGCVSCRAELDGYTEVVDELLLLVPEREPPAGFEMAVLAGLAPPPPRPRPRRRAWRRALVPVTAALLTAAVAGGTAAELTWRSTSDDRR